MGRGQALGRSEVKGVEIIQMCAKGLETGFVQILCEYIFTLLSSLFRFSSLQLVSAMTASMILIPVIQFLRQF